jgi:hypothetical protein
LSASVQPRSSQGPEKSRKKTIWSSPN